jgi:hypothetical protein
MMDHMLNGGHESRRGTTSEMARCDWPANNRLQRTDLYAAAKLGSCLPSLPKSPNFSRNANKPPFFERHGAVHESLSGLHIAD